MSCACCSLGLLQSGFLPMAERPAPEKKTQQPDYDHLFNFDFLRTAVHQPPEPVLQLTHRLKVRRALFSFRYLFVCCLLG